MALNNFLPFATGGGANVATQSAYAADPLLPIGNQPGIAVSAFNNKALRQANAVASSIGQFLADKTGADILDNGVAAQLLAQINAALLPLAPIITNYSAGSGTHNLTYYFFIASGSATVGATYTNNAVTFTVKATVAAGVQIAMSGNGAPSVSGVLTKASGTGDATLTFYAMRAPLQARVRLVGAGGGGGGSGSLAGNGGAGGNSTFGAALLTAAGGSGGFANQGTPAAGGAATINAPAQTIIGVAGGTGTSGGGGSSGAAVAGGCGGSSALGGGAGGGPPTGAGGSAPANTGGGGGGGGAQNTALDDSGSGGGAGAYVEAFIPSPTGSYAYAVGAAGTAGASGGGRAGGAGGSGLVVVEERYQ
jgi:hypothetical protein